MSLSCSTKMTKKCVTWRINCALAEARNLFMGHWRSTETCSRGRRAGPPLACFASVVLLGDTNALDFVMPWSRMSLPASASSSASYPCIFVTELCSSGLQGPSRAFGLGVLFLEPCEIDRKDPTLTKPLASGVTAPRVVIRLSSCANKDKQDQHQKVYNFPCSKNRSGRFLPAAETGAESKCKGKRAPARQIKSQSNTLGSSLPS